MIRARRAGTVGAMANRWAGWFAVGGVVVLSSCSTVVQTSADSDPDRGGAGAVTTPVTSQPVPSTTAAPTSTSSTSTTTTSTTTSTTMPPTTTTTLPPLDVFDPACVVQVQTGDSLESIVASRSDYTVDVATVQAENGLVDTVIQPDQLLDVCVDNGFDDITGELRNGRNAAVVQREVVAQQEKLNQLFAGLGIRELLVDGISGPVTRQRLCAARLALGLPVSTEDMVAGSPEEQVLMAAQTLPMPFTTALLSERWILIDRTCQIMFVGEGTGRLVFVFPTSTGEPGFETRDQDRSPVFRFNPAFDNGGWHNSTTYPVAEDNPLNGNMYKPLYFDRGQAIHGANNVPTTPQSKGCARLRVEHQDMLLYWLGLHDSGPTTNRGRINVTVTVQGTWIPR